MATIAPSIRRNIVVPDRFDLFLSAAAAVMLVLALTAVAKGAGGWARVQPQVWLHLLTVLAALALTPFLLLMRRGTRRHRQIGYAWCVALFATAFASLFVHGINGGFSPIHALSVLTLVAVPRIIHTARTHQVAKHRLTVRIVTSGALILAGAFTLLPSRQLGHWLFS